MEGNIKIIKEAVEAIEGVDQPTNDKPGVSNNTSTQRIACPFYKEGRCRFGDMCSNYHDPNMKPIENRKFSEKGLQKNNMSKQKKLSYKEHKSKQKMRTAIDVIHRVQWDDNLPEELITIGYEDRFKGIQVGFWILISAMKLAW